MSQFLKQWSYVMLASAVTMSLLDAILLQRSRSLFTGGFLSVDHLDSPSAIIAFLFLSILIDAGIGGLLAAVVMWMQSRLQLRRAAIYSGGLLAATAPLLVSDVVSYNLTRYLGADFDLALMFDLTGRSIAEMLAVSSPQVATVTLAVAGAIVIACVGLWWLNRRFGPRALAVPVRVLVLPTLLALGAGFALTAGVLASDALENGLLRKPSGKALRFVINGVTDIDRDGFGMIGRLSDPDPRNAAIYPYAADIPGNGIDEDGAAGDLPVSAEKYNERQPSHAAWQRSSDVVLVVLESFRADLVGGRHQNQAITPVMDSLSARGFSSSDAYSHNGYTVQSRFHLLAGTFNVRRNAQTLIDDFKRQGYRVGYFSGQDESFGSDEYRVGFDRADVAYDARQDVARRYSTFATPGSLAVSSGAEQEQVDVFIAGSRHDRRPMFVYVNFEDTHFPYSHGGIQSVLSDTRLARGEIEPAQRDALWAMYANTAANVDRAIGRMLETMRQARGVEPAIVITADHGESLFDDGVLGHGYALNDVQTRVPFIVANLPMRVREPFSHVDVRSALIEALQVRPEAPAIPVSEKSDRPVFQYLGDLRRPRQIALLSDRQRFIFDFRTNQVQPWAGTWRRVADLAGPDYEDYVRLIRYWEWMNLARRNPSNGGQ